MDRGRGSIKKQRSRSEDIGKSSVLSPTGFALPKRSETLFRMDTRRVAANSLLAIEASGRQSVAIVRRVATIIMAEYPLEVLKNISSGARDSDDDNDDDDGDDDDESDGSGSDDDWIDELIQTPKDRFKVFHSFLSS
jgi:hypothetical protein